MKKWIVIVIVIVVIFGGFFLFTRFRNQSANASTNYQTVAAERGSLTGTVGATGVVRANQTAPLSWQTTGTVGEVNIAVGDQVQVDDILATLEKTSLSQAVILAQADLVGAEKALNDLKSSQIQQAQALKTVEDAQQALEDAKNPELLQAKALEALAAAQKNVENAGRTLRWAQSPANQSYIDEAQAQVTLAKDRLDRAKEKYTPYENKPEDNVTRARLLSDYSAAQQQYDLAVRQLNSMQGTAGETDIALQEANLAKAQAQLQDAQRAWERVKDGTSAADIALLEAQLEDAQREYERIKDGPDPDDLAAAEARVAAAQATLRLSQIAAPFSGTVTNAYSKPGDQVAPGTQAFRLDDLSHLLVDVQASEVDINRIQTNQPVKLLFDAIPNKEYNGVVSQVSPVGNSSQAGVDFTVTIELVDADQNVKPGMTAGVNVVVNQLEDVLLVPNRAVRVQDGKRVVYVLKNNVPTPIEITLGASSETDSQVMDGELQPGDLIVLNPPTVFSQNGSPAFMSGGQ